MALKEEWFDVVDESDRVISKALRKDVHAKRLLHRAIHVFVFNKAGEIFLQKRSLLKDMCPGLWDSSCSGHVDSGEDYDTAAPRELGEELGIKLSVLIKRWFYLEACDQTGREFVWVYVLKHEGPFVLHPEEIETGRWYSTAELNQRIVQNEAEFSPAFLHIWRTASRMLKPD